MTRSLVDRVLEFYPRVYYACHTRHVVDEAARVTLTANQASVLDHLDEEEGVSLYDLAMHMGVTPSTMSIAVNRLVKLGYVDRLRSASDARRLELRLSPAGIRVKRAKSVLDPTRVRAVLARLSAKERAAAVHGLGLLAYAAELELKKRSLDRAWSRRGTKQHKRPGRGRE